LNLTLFLFLLLLLLLSVICYDELQAVKTILRERLGIISSSHTVL